jgi:hypothetical protein
MRSMMKKMFKMGKNPAAAQALFSNMKGNF